MFKKFVLQGCSQTKDRRRSLWATLEDAEVRTKLADFFNILPVDYGWDIVRRQACRRDMD